ncbi:hypothetical protein PUN28_007641 [Cardiocondyla obscurior]|uniref:Uncharacterized protein n=1 Tax=Cardiocondyla obscurior TaxID=286306 RepID=A0AAW2G651_9HYME
MYLRKLQCLIWHVRGINFLAIIDRRCKFHYVEIFFFFLSFSIECVLRIFPILARFRAR